jgi:hypothetical protein
MTRPIDGSTSSNPYPECDEESGVCGAQPQPLPQYSRDLSQNQSRADADGDWHAPILPPAKPTQLAQVAKNMSTPKPATDAELRATYEKMSDADLEKEVKSLGKRLSDGNNGQYSGADLDKQKFHAAEAVAKSRADAARPPAHASSQVEGWEDHCVAHVGLTKDRDGVEAELAFHKTDNVTFLDVGGEASEQQLGPHATFFHGKTTEKLGGVDFSISADVGAVEVGPGIHNADGSTGLHLGGTATSGGVEGTVHKDGWGSITGGLGAGLSAEASVGVKVEGDKTFACGRVSWDIVTVGVCFPIPGRF